MSDDYEDADLPTLQGLDMLPRIIRNSAICLLCEQVIESQWGHDFRTCKCGNLSVDGGHEYVRRVFKAYGTWKETSLYGLIRPEDSIVVEDSR